MLGALQLKETELNNFRKARDTKLEHERSKFRELAEELDAVIEEERKRVEELDTSWF